MGCFLISFCLGNTLLPHACQPVLLHNVIFEGQFLDFAALAATFEKIIRPQTKKAICVPIKIAFQFKLPSPFPFPLVLLRSGILSKKERINSLQIQIFLYKMAIRLQNSHNNDKMEKNTVPAAAGIA